MHPTTQPSTPRHSSTARQNNFNTPSALRAAVPEPPASWWPSLTWNLLQAFMACSRWNCRRCCSTDCGSRNLDWHTRHTYASFLPADTGEQQIRRQSFGRLKGWQKDERTRPMQYLSDMQNKYLYILLDFSQRCLYHIIHERGMRVFFLHK